jgi:hypothetical protein
VWISRRPVVFVDSGGGKKENGGGVWVAHRPVAVADAAGRRGEKIGRRVGSTPPVINAAGEEPSPRRWGE